LSSSTTISRSCFLPALLTKEEDLDHLSCRRCARVNPPPTTRGRTGPPARAFPRERLLSTENCQLYLRLRARQKATALLHLAPLVMLVLQRHVPHAVASCGLVAQRVHRCSLSSPPGRCLGRATRKRATATSYTIVIHLSSRATRQQQSRNGHSSTPPLIHPPENLQLSLPLAVAA
jgi:hypothetical protein